ncbi:hypothetical protein LOAG_13145 [Loa loa]|uniref:Uncharacterized protein n=1 Tax=Loa loa TaxID=7209 RepID=A0A1S0TL11_LOALO|nr:hypothetical protein LOAG_13145 [Loa loa]EFO15365.1 hypothetical protein LOAG_13145 [Loa loa]
MIGKSGNSSRKLITNGSSSDTINASDNSFPFEDIFENRTHEFEPKHQILSNEDIQHFLQPYLPLSNSINPLYSTDTCVDDVKKDQFIRDKSSFDMCQLRDIPTSSNIIHPKCYHFRVNTVSIASAVITAVLTLLFVGYIIVNASNNRKFNIWLKYSLVVFAILMLIFIGFFVGGILHQRKSWMLPLIASMIFSCISLFGILIIMITITTDNTCEGNAKYFNERILFIANIIIFRISGIFGQHFWSTNVLVPLFLIILYTFNYHYN